MMDSDQTPDTPQEAEEIEVVEVDPGEYPWAESIEEQRRSFIFSTMGNADIAGEVLIANMQMVLDWVKDGTVPKPKPGPRAPRDLSLTK